MRPLVRLSLFAVAALAFAFASPLPALAQGRPDIQWMRGGHSDIVSDMKFTPDGQRLVTSGMDGTVKVFRVSDGILLRTFLRPDGQIFSLGSATVAVSPDSQTLAIGDFVSTPSKATLVYLYNLSDGALQRTLSGFTPACNNSGVCDYVARLSFSADGSNLLVTKDIVRVSDGAILRTMPSGLSGYSYSPDGSRILAHDSGGAEEIDPDTFATIRSLNDNSVDRYSPDGAYAYTVDGRGATIKRLSDLSYITLTGGTSAPYGSAAAFSPNGQYFAASLNVGTNSVKVWQVSGGSTTWSLVSQFQTLYTAQVAFSPDGQTLAAADETISLHNSADGAFARSISVLGSGPVESISFSADGQSLATANPTSFASSSGLGTLQLWNAADGSPRNVNFSQSVGVNVDQVFITPDNQGLLTLDSPNVRFWNANDGSLIRTVHPTHGAGSLSLSPNGQIYAVGAAFNSHALLELYQASDDTLIRTLNNAGNRGSVFSPDGQMIATGGEFVSVEIFNVSDGSVVRALNTLGDPSRISPGMAFSPDGQTLAVAEEVNTNPRSGVIELFRISDGALLRTFGTFGDWASSVAFSPDGQTIIGTGHDNTVRIWRVSDGAQLTMYTQETGQGNVRPGPYQVAYSPNGQRFAYGRADATVVVANNPYALGHFNVSMTASRNPAPVGQNFNYNVSVTNDGAGPSNNTTLTDVLPTLVTLTSAAPSQGACAYAPATRTVTCSLGALAAGASATVQLTVKPRDEGTLDNTASASAPNYATASASVNRLPAQKLVDLSVSKTDSADPIFVGDNTVYTMTVKNSNTVNYATGVTLADNLPSGMTFVSATTSQGSLVTPPAGSTGVVTADIGTMAPNATVTVTVTVKATAAGVQGDTATVSSNEADSNTANNTSTQSTTVNVSGVASLQKVLLASQVLTGGCQNTTGQVYLSSPSPAGGASVTLSSSVSGASVPASVFIPAGQTVSPVFDVTTSPVAAKQTGLITATSGPNSVSRGITINVGNGTCP